MKKFLGIIILGLLLSGCTTARQEISKGGIDPGISKNQLKRQLEATALSEDPFLSGCYRQYYPNLRLEVLSSRSRSVYFIFEKVYESSVGCSRSLVGDGRLAKITYSRHDVETYIDAKKPKTTTTKVTKSYTPTTNSYEESFNIKTTWWDRTVWFFEDLFESDESEKDKEITELRKRIKRLESNRGTANEIRELKKCVQDISMGLPCYPY